MHLLKVNGSNSYDKCVYSRKHHSHYPQIFPSWSIFPISRQSLI